MNKVMLDKKRQLKPGEMIKLSYDEAFKIMYADPANIEILTAFLSKVLGVEYEELENKVTLLPLKTPKKTIGEKITERDIVVKIQDTKTSKIILEVNISDEKRYIDSILNRNLLYLNDVSSGGITSEDRYDKMPRTILFNLNNFFVNEREKVIDEYRYRNEEGDILTSNNVIVNINIDKCYKLWYYKEYKGLSEKEKEIVISCAALCTRKVSEFKDCLEEIEIKPEIKKIMEKVVLRMIEDEGLVRRFYRSEEDDKKLRESILNEAREKIREEAHREGLEKGIQEGIKEGIKEGIQEGIKEGIQEGIKEGLEKGIKEGTVQVAKKLKLAGMDIFKIQELTGLEIAEIEKL